VAQPGQGLERVVAQKRGQEAAAVQPEQALETAAAQQQKQETAAAQPEQELETVAAQQGEQEAAAAQSEQGLETEMTATHITNIHCLFVCMSHVFLTPPTPMLYVTYCLDLVS